jgi:ribosomal protein RSM22 (predicted rRNA methylase)
MTGSDWCHFAVRLERSAEHRQAKDVSLGYEDEKYSYLIASKIPSSLPTARILRPPQRRSGHTILTLCSEGHVQQSTISKKQKDLYKQSRKADWGDCWPPTPQSSDSVLENQCRE